MRANVPALLAIALTVPSIARAQKAAGYPLPIPGRSMVLTKLGIVAASQPLAAKAGVQILERGGNAIDAAIAANATMGLVEPHMNGIGGDLFAIVYEAKTGKLYGLNAGGWAPTGLTPELLASKGQTRMPNRGIYSVTVPGAVAGWDALRTKFGTKPFSELLAPAIYYAEQGFPVTEVIAHEWAADSRSMTQPNAKATYLIDGRAPREGEVFKNPDLAKSLRRIAEKGRAGFYAGPTAEAILALSKSEGGTFTAADFTEFQPEWQDPIKTTYHGWTVYEMPPNGQGIAALMMLNIMERYPLAEWGFHSTKALHVMIEAKKLAYADMLRYVGDPRFSQVPVAQLLDKSTAEKRAALIDPSKAQCDVSPLQIAGLTDSHGGDTIYLTVIDKDGNIVSLIQSDYSGSGPAWWRPGPLCAAQSRGTLLARPKSTLTRSHPGSVRCTRSFPASWRRTACASALVSWAAGINRRPTRNSSPISRTTA